MTMPMPAEWAFGATIPTRDPDRTRRAYEDVLGAQVVIGDPGGPFQPRVLSCPAIAWPRISSNSRGPGLPSCGLCRVNAAPPPQHLHGTPRRTTAVQVNAPTDPRPRGVTCCVARHGFWQIA